MSWVDKDPMVKVETTTATMALLNAAIINKAYTRLTNASQNPSGATNGVANKAPVNNAAGMQTLPNKLDASPW